MSLYRPILVSASKGFTLVELIIVVMLLGILAVTAMPRFLNLQDDARISTLKGVKGALQAVVDQVKVEANMQNRTNEQGYLLDVEGVIIRTYFDAAREAWAGQSGATGLQGLLEGNFAFTGSAAHNNASLKDQVCTAAEVCVIDRTITSNVIPGKQGYGVFFYPRKTKLNDNCFAYYAFSTDTPGTSGATEIVYRETAVVETGC